MLSEAELNFLFDFDPELSNLTGDYRLKLSGSFFSMTLPKILEEVNSFTIENDEVLASGQVPVIENGMQSFVDTENNDQINPMRGKELYCALEKSNLITPQYKEQLCENQNKEQEIKESNLSDVFNYFQDERLINIEKEQTNFSSRCVFFSFVKQNSSKDEYDNSLPCSGEEDAQPDRKKRRKLNP